MATMKYTPDYSGRDAYYANKDAAVAARKAEKARKQGLLARVLARLFPEKREPVAHDYRKGLWGHTAEIIDWSDDDRRVTKMYGFGTGIEVGDFIIKSHDEGWCSYRVDEIEYKDDPPDMWLAQATWTPGVFGVVDGKIVRLPLTNA